MKVKYWPNKITSNQIELELLTKITTLIWENWSGKSAILEKILENHFDEEESIVISYSSWLNESFSSIFNNKIEVLNSQLKSNNVPDNELKWFYFNSKWSDILIYLAYMLEDWKTKEFIDNHIFLRSKEIKFNFSINNETYKRFVIEAIKLNENWDYNLLMSNFHNQLDIFLKTSLGNNWKEIDFTKSLNIKNDTLNNKSIKYLFDIKKEAENEDWEIIKLNDKQWKLFRNIELLSFLWIISSYIMKVEDTKLYFWDNTLNDLSDWEFQLLVIYSLLDLFDWNNTLFLFDEVDSHLHYKNINKLWEILSSIEWKIITTTHIPDSIINNEIKQIKVVKDWIIDNDNTVNSLIKRLWNISDAHLYEKKLASKVENIVLIDDCTDWFIFLELAKIKKWSNYNTKIESVQPIKCNSWFNWNPNEIFWEKKLNWINEFILKNNSFDTKKIFSLCDKDECPIAKIDDNMKFKEYHDWNNKKTQQFWTSWNIYYLSWKRREIENYFLSFTLLTEFWFLDEVNNELWNSSKLQTNNTWDNDWIRDFQAKEIVQKFAQKELNWNYIWKDYNDLKEIISKIPKDEISEDIEKMYDFIISKIK